MYNLSDIANKESALTERIKAAGKLAVAFSGGVDSTYLLYKAHKILGDDCVAVTVKSLVLTFQEFDRTSTFCKKIGVKQIVVDVDVFSIPEFVNNSPDRCYYCKKKLFASIMDAVPGYELTDGSNVDDQGDFRPGMKALKELGVSSLLKECGLTKNEIRELSKDAGLGTWKMPSAACLASRIAYGEKITPEALMRVAYAEKIIKDLGFSGIRVRVHGDLARIEALPEDISLMTYEHTRKEISQELKRLGFKYVTIDVDGYRTGSMNEAIGK